MPKSVYYLGGRILVGIGQLVMIRVLTSILSPAEIGKYYLLISMVGIVSLVLISPVLMYISRHFYGWHQAGIGWAMIKKLFVFLIMVSAVSTLVLIVLKPFHLLGDQLSYGSLCILIPLLISGIITSVYPQELLNIIGKFRAFVLLNNFELWGRITLICLFAMIYSPTAITVLGALTAWSLFFSIISGTVLYRCVQHVEKKNAFTVTGFRDIFNFAWPFSIASGLYWCQADGYRFVLQHVSDLEAVGKFVVGFSLGATPILAIEGLFQQMYLPIFYKEISAETIESHTAAWNKYAKKVIRVFIPFAFYGAFAGPFLAHWLLHSTYWDVGIYAAFGAISQLFRIFSGTLTNGIIARKQTAAMLAPNLIGAIMALAGTFFLAGKNPMIGTGIALVLSYLAVSIGLYFKLADKIRIQIPFTDILKSITLIAPVCIILAVSFKFGFASVPVMNILVLFITGISLIYIQYTLSKDVWLFSR
jgi:O-antigen/teichoic acid export membrane protein